MDNLTIGYGTTINDIVKRGKVYGRKYDDDKTRMDLLMGGCAKSLEQVAKVLTFGAKGEPEPISITTEYKPY